MPTCPICSAEKLSTRKTRWWGKVQGRLIWRCACRCTGCGWSGWIPGEARAGVAPQAVEAQVYAPMEEPGDGYRPARPLTT